MKRRIFLLLLVLLGSLTLVACGGNKDNNKVRKTVISYCGWDLGSDAAPSIKRKMIEKFNNTHPTIYIEMIEPQGNYDEFINTLAYAGNLPDVFLVNSVANTVAANYAMDITLFAEADDEWENVNVALRESCTYYDSIYAIPSAQNYLGLFANYTLINDEANISKDAEDMFAAGEYTYEQLISTIKAVNKVDAQDGSGFVGYGNTGSMISWLPSVLDSQLANPQGVMHYIWDGEKLDMNGETMIKALEIINDLGNPNADYTYQALAPAEGEDDMRETIFGVAGEQAVFQAGRMAFFEAASYYTFDEKNMDFDWEFVALPNGKVIAALDYLCISKATVRPDEAFEVAKFMTYGADGINTRYEVVDENEELSLSGLPINTDMEVSGKWFDYVGLPGVKEVYEKVSEGKITVIVEPNKTTPGYLQARFHQKTGVVIEGLRGDAEYAIGDFVWDVALGSVTVSQYRAAMTDELEALINKNITDAYKAIKAIVDADRPNRVAPKVPEVEAPEVTE